MITRKTLLLAFIALTTALLVPAATAEESSSTPPYVGEWSNGRGEVMVVTARTMKYGDTKVTFTDVTKASDGTLFHLKVAGDVDETIFSPFLQIQMGEGGEMLVKGYATWDAMMQDAEGASEMRWYRD